MLNSLYTAVSGLQSYQTEMDVVGNNIANVNTSAFKYGQTTFEESFSQILQGATRPENGTGGINPTAIGMGVQVSGVNNVFTQGTLQSTGTPTDMAIQGNSFFVVGQGNQTYYTRSGNFQIDADGTLVSPANGYAVQGRMATGGVLGTAQTDIVIPTNQSIPAKTTTTASMSGNLDASAPTIAAADPANPTAIELADPKNAQSVNQTTLGVYDSLGNKHDLTVVSWKVSPTQWDYKIDPTSLNADMTKPYTLGAGAESSPAGSTTPWQFTFKSDGTIDTSASNIPPITFTPAGAGTAMTLTLNPGSGTTGVTSYSSTSSAVLSGQDGYASGSIQSISVGQDGTITGAFSNGTNQILAQVALANFNNPGGLENAGNNMYSSSANSGTAVVGYSGTTTLSTIQGGALEMSNVDLAQQFTEMIVAERAFQANSKMISTSDTMLQNLINMPSQG